MTDNPNPEEAVVALRVEAARAAIAAGLAARAGLSFAGSRVATSPQLSLSPYWPLGYEVQSELIVLEQIMQPRTSDAGPNLPAGGLTPTDLLISETAAFLFDKLVNPVLPLQPISPEVGDLVPLNAVYEEVLHRARFAGSVRVTSPAFIAATRVLYIDDDQGGRTETAAYRQYLDFDRKAREAQDAVDAASVGDSDRAVKERDRVLAEWLIRGHRREIDDAIRVILQEELAAGFEDERAQLIQRLAAGRRARIDAPGFSYFPARLVPIRPLLDSGAEPSGWTAVEIDPPQLRRLLANTEQPLPLPEGSIEPLLEGFRRLTFEFIVCDVVRDWLNEQFFGERFWRLAAGELLADGVGGGRLPGYAASLVFIREASIEYAGPVAAQISRRPETTPRFPVRTVRIVAAERSPRVLDSARSLAAARDLKLPLAIARLTTVARQPVETPSTIVLSATKRAFRALPVGIFPFGGKPKITVRDHSQDHTHDLQLDRLDKTAQVVPIRVFITSAVGRLDTISVEVETPDSVVRRPALIGNQDSVSGTVNVPAPVGGRSSHVVVRVLDGTRKLDQETVDIGRESINVRCSVTAEPLVMVLAASIPTLLGHIVRSLPKCPDPDEALSWQ